MNESTFDFLNEWNEDAFKLALDMERQYYIDSDASLTYSRKFIEELAKDMVWRRKLPTGSLMEMIRSLQVSHVLSSKSIDDLHYVRKLGNNAAHNHSTESSTHLARVHKAMFDIAVDYCTRHFDMPNIPHYTLPSVPALSTPQMDEQSVKDLFMQLIGDVGLAVSPNAVPEESLQVEDVKRPALRFLNGDVQDNYLFTYISRLQETSKDAVENGNDPLSELSDYLHVDRKIQLELVEQLKNNTGNQLILLCGNVGDGKSHLLSYLQKTYPELLSDYKIYNDATESFDPTKNAVDTLSERLKDFSDQFLQDNSNPSKMILAINIGMLAKFLEYTKDESEYTYSALREFVEETNVLKPGATVNVHSKSFKLFNFLSYQPYELTEKGPKSSFYSTLLKKICSDSVDNPFYDAYRLDRENEIDTILHRNYALLSQKDIQDQIVQVLIELIVKHHELISVRAFFNLISDLLIPVNWSELKHVSVKPSIMLKNGLPEQLFNRPERSTLLNQISKLDPLRTRHRPIDDLYLSLYTGGDVDEILAHLDENAQSFYSPDQVDGIQEWTGQLIRLMVLSNPEFAETVLDSVYRDYLQYLYQYNKGDTRRLQPLYDISSAAYYKWFGSPKPNYVYKKKITSRHRLAFKAEIEGNPMRIKSSTENILSKFSSTILLDFNKKGNDHDTAELEIDYPLFQLFMDIQDGYRPTIEDDHRSIKFLEFAEKIHEMCTSSTEVMIVTEDSKQAYLLSQDRFGTKTFKHMGTAED
ncbi:DNA phosphorothioation-dependent restriction protein DptF [Exiguobacterium sp. s127]|uniref:DNA phosphorothioation-dependent restriction protein DptF n=1 Tax=Exiguobacterium sp. s127 TaxID=2751210 RepID=UPI001BEC87E2|nr:DNA phosphorothioation-dependent restriction protein DptF [Exiguobacterium sp. s127]